MYIVCRWRMVLFESTFDASVRCDKRLLSKYTSGILEDAKWCLSRSNRWVGTLPCWNRTIYTPERTRFVHNGCVQVGCGVAEISFLWNHHNLPFCCQWSLRKLLCFWTSQLLVPYPKIVFVGDILLKTFEDILTNNLTHIAVLGFIVVICTRYTAFMHGQNTIWVLHIFRTDVLTAA